MDRNEKRPQKIAVKQQKRGEIAEQKKTLKKLTFGEAAGVNLAAEGVVGVAALTPGALRLWTTKRTGSPAFLIAETAAV